jgi:predicted amidophosphoribosyltransferase
MFRFVSELLNDFFDLLYPTLCLGCKQTLEKQEKLLCVHCRMLLPETGHHLVNESELINKFAGKVKVMHAASYYRYAKGSVVQKLIHEIKYKDQPEAAVQVGQWYGYQLKEECPWINEIDVLIGVPLHKKRLRERGYNQADCIAKGLSTATDIPMQTSVMIRTRFKGSQMWIWSFGLLNPIRYLANTLSLSTMF